MSPINPCVRMFDHDIEEEIDSGNWSTTDEGNLCVADQEYEILGDPENIDDALMLACVVTEGVH